MRILNSLTCDARLNIPGYVRHIPAVEDVIPVSQSVMPRLSFRRIPKLSETRLCTMLVR